MTAGGCLPRCPITAGLALDVVTRGNQGSHSLQATERWRVRVEPVAGRATVVSLGGATTDAGSVDLGAPEPGAPVQTWSVPTVSLGATLAG